MNKELEEAISICNAIKKNIKCESTFDLNILKLNRNNELAIEILLNYIDNSISKEDIKEKLEELNENGYWNYLEERDLEKTKNILQELLEGK